jgi:retron-type reverse transcriptase
VYAAIRKIQQNVLRYSWVIDLDIQEFFENVSHGLLLRGLERYVSQKWILVYIKRWLEAPIILEDLTIKVPT